MKILAMDSAAQACSVAIWQNDKVTHHHLEKMARGHASELLPMVQGLLDEAGLSVLDMDALAVTVGPGGFTGLRIALASARGLAVASKKPVIGVTTLEALAYGAKQLGRDMPILAALDAKRADLYAQVFDKKGQSISDAMARLPEDVAKLAAEAGDQLLICGDSFERLAPLFGNMDVSVINAELEAPDARYVAEIAAQKGLPSVEESRPSAFYIRPPDAELPKNGGRLRP